MPFLLTIYGSSRSSISHPSKLMQISAKLERHDTSVCAEGWRIRDAHDTLLHWQCVYVFENVECNCNCGRAVRSLSCLWPIHIYIYIYIYISIYAPRVTFLRLNTSSFGEVPAPVHHHQNHQNHHQNHLNLSESSESSSSSSSSESLSESSSESSFLESSMIHTHHHRYIIIIRIRIRIRIRIIIISQS